MNLLHRAMLSQQQRRQSKLIICPVCELPALFTFHGYQQDGQDGRVEKWACGNCGTAVVLGDLWPIAPVARVPVRYKEVSLSIPAVVEDRRQFELAEVD